MTLTIIVYIGNILVAGWVSISSLFFPKTAQRTVFSNDFAYSDAFKLVGALWGAIFIISVLGLFYPQEMRLIFLFQLIYKLSWLLFAALPAIKRGISYPRGMAVYFIIWIVILPFVIPWSEFF